MRLVVSGPILNRDMASLVGFEVLSAVVTNVAIFRYIAPCSFILALLVIICFKHLDNHCTGG
jgi:hypothetical protein